MNCKVCKSNNIIKLNNFKPYIDTDMEFIIYDCLDCQSRFAENENLNIYKNSLYSQYDSPYEWHYIQAEFIKNLFANDLEKSKKEISKNNIIFNNVLSYVERANNKDISILEVGCATGYITAYFNKIGYKNSYGIDISSEPIEYAKKNFGNYYGLQALKQKYDVIFFQGVVGCVEKPADFLNHYASLLSENGVMFFNAPNVNSVIETNEIWVDSPPPDVITLFHKDTFNKVFDHNYKINFYETTSLMEIFKKNINKILRKNNNIYPRRFVYDHNAGKSTTNFKKIVRRLIIHTVKFILFIKVLKRFSSEYGLIFQVNKP